VADQGAEGVLSPFLRIQRLRMARPFLAGRILDVGCGSGALAGEVSPDRYLGVDIDALSLKLSRVNHPQHAFARQLPAEEQQFDTIVSLAVIEHVSNPGEFLADLAKRLSDRPDAKIVISTPHPSMDWIHDLGSSIGLFSSHANEEHEQLLDRTVLARIGAEAWLHMAQYRRFMLGANQLALCGRR
jgi:2-polyprenyl-3-methyl-5-hydroxy-6-metoxy-1,4-benzoquinol methylase